MKLKQWQIIVTIICLILGTILHFTYEWSLENPIIGILSAVNESTWEHLKLVFYPMCIMAIVGYFIIGKKYKKYWFSQAKGIILSMAFVIVVFYTYTGVIGKNISFIDILTFIVSILIGQCVIYKTIRNKNDFNREKISVIFLVTLTLLFITFTFYPPKIALFEDPIFGTFGIGPKRID